MLHLSLEVLLKFNIITQYDFILNGNTMISMTGKCVLCMWVCEGLIWATFIQFVQKTGTDTCGVNVVTEASVVLLDSFQMFFTELCKGQWGKRGWFMIFLDCKK